MDSIAVPLGLLCVSACSCAHLYAREPGKQGRIRLLEGSAVDADDAESDQGLGDGSGSRQQQDDEDGEDTREAQDEDEDVPEWLLQDEVSEEGVPVDLENWWYKVRLQKAALVLTLALADTAACLTLGWDAMTRTRDRYRLAEDAMMVVYWTILVTLGIMSFPKRNIARHFRYTVYITILAVSVSLTTWARLLTPSSSIGIPATVMATFAPKGEYVSFVLSVITACLATIAFLLAGTIPHAPAYHFRSPYTYTVASDLGDAHSANVSKNIEASVLGTLLFSWVSPVIREGSTKLQMGLDDLPHLSASFRTVTLFRNFRKSSKKSVEINENQSTLDDSLSREPRDGLGYAPRIFNRLLWRLLVVNKLEFALNCSLALLTAFLYYLPAFFLNKVLQFLEVANQVEGRDRTLGYAYCGGLFVALILDAIATGQLWYISNCMLASRIRIQMNSVIFAKTLRRKDITGSAGRSGDDSDSEDGQAATKPNGAKPDKAKSKHEDDDDDDESTKVDADTFASKHQVLNLFSVDCDRVADSAGWSFSLIDAPVELFIGTLFLYQLLGYAGIVGIAVTVLFLPVNHWTSKHFATVQDRLMAARDRRVSLMTEVLSSIRYIKFMAYEKPFEKRILEARKEELKQQRSNYMLEIAFNFIWGASPIACVLVSFFVYVKIMGNPLTPSVAFTSLAVFNELEYAINVLPDTFISALQCLVSLRRIERYLDLPDVEHIGSSEQLVSLKELNKFTNDKPPVSLVNATIAWPAPARDDDSGDSPDYGQRTPALGARTPARRFMLPDVTVDFPVGKLTLICGPLGSGKTLLLLALLGEADLLSGQIVCPRSPINTLSVTSDSQKLSAESWLLPVCAYVPQSAWLLNASIQDNILFGLPLDYQRYTSTLEACSLLTDLAILEDGDQTEIGEKGVNLSGGQKARVSLARAVYSRASYVFLDDVLSAVDAHTAAHLFDKCLRGPLMKGRTVILVSHHVQLCAPGAGQVVHLDNGMLAFTGSSEDYMQTALYSKEQADEGPEEKAENPAIKLTNKNLAHLAEKREMNSSTSSLSELDTSGSSEEEEESKPVAPPRKLVEDEARAVGRVSTSVWTYYLTMNGGAIFWVVFLSIFVAAKGSEVLEAYWLRIWSNSYDTKGQHDKPAKDVNFYLTVYAILTLATIIVDTLQWIILYIGGLRASTKMYEIILRATFRAPLRFFDTMALGRLQNRFGKDFEQIDAQLPDHLGKTLMYILGVITTLLTVASVSPVFILAFVALCLAYTYYARLYATTAREMRRLDSVTKSPVFSLYGEAIAGVAVIRAFGAQARFMLLQIQRVDKNIAFYYYLWAANRWLSVRFSLLSAALVGATGLILLALSGSINASVAGFALSFALNISNNMLFLVRRYTALELAMVGVERIKEYSEIPQEPPEIVEPRPPAGWPHAGEVIVDKLCIRYAPELPRVLHEVSFKMNPGEKVGIVGATGSGKSTMALSFFRFVEADEGAIVIDGINIANIGLADLRSRLTIIPQDPTILSGSLRSTLDPLDEYPDEEIFDALRRARLLPAESAATNEAEELNYNPFFDLDTEVSEQGQNFSAGERQLLCLARALLQQHPLILMDEATSSVDYETDALITTTIAEEFKRSSLLVIAHRLRTVIGFDKILVLDAGRVMEFDSPAKLIADTSSQFHALCKATGRREFKILTRLSKRDYPPGAVLKRRKTKRSSSGRQDSK